MTDPVSLDDLVSRWQQGQREGRPVPLEELCADCPERLEELKQRLQAVASMASFLGLATSPPSEAATLARAPIQAANGQAGPGGVPGYEILGELGRGGMGVVYQARQIKLNRLVALKMILAGGHAGEAERQRFLTEAEAVARLQHPNIVQIHEIGEADGHPFFSLEFCPGGSLAAKLAGTPLSPPEAARLVEILARAVQAAHEAGVVHRDLKPANVLLLADGTPKVTDFGLAKKLDGAAGQTASGAILGTPSYMAPEQAGGKTKEIGPAADVYALGAILYECLTGRPPFKAATAFDTVLQVLSEEPVPPSRLLPGLPRDLETICLKCLQKESKKRYASAAALAEDLRRFRAGEAITARPVGRLERGWKWVRRNPVVAGSVAAVAVALLVGAGLATLFALQAEARARGEKQAREAAQKTQRAAEWLTYTSQLALAQREWQDNNVGHARALVDACQPDLRGWEHAYLRHLCDSHQQTLLVHTGLIHRVRWSPDGKRLAGAGSDGTVKVWDAVTGQEVLTLKGHTGLVFSVCWNPDGKRLASASGGYDTQKKPVSGEVKVWDVATGQEALTFKGYSGDVWDVCWSPDGQRLASAGEDRTVKVWDAVGGHEALTLKGHSDAVRSVCWSPDGKRLASASLDSTVKVWESASGREVLSFAGHRGSVWDVCWSPDGQRLASASDDKTVRVWGAAKGHEVLTLRGHTGPVLSACWRPDGKGLASASDDGTVKVWDAATGQEAHSLKGHTAGVISVCWSPDSQRLASAGAGSNAKGQLFGEVRVWDAVTDREARSLKGGGGGVCWSPNGQRLASAGMDGTVKVWDASTGQQALSLQRHTLPVTSVCWSPDGKRLASASWDYTVKVWDAASGQEAFTLQGHTGVVRSVCWSPDGQRLASASDDWTVKVWNAAGGQEALTLKGHTGHVVGVCWSPDGQRLASASEDGTVKVWDATPIRDEP